MTRILTATVLILITGLASGDNCRQRVLVQDQYQQQAVIATYAPAILTVPHYSTGYAQDGQNSLEARLAALEGKIDALLGKPAAQTKNAEQLPPPGPAQPRPNPASGAAPHPALAVFASKCASCHDQARTKKPGGGFYMSNNGELLPWTVLQAGLVGSMSYCKDMPKDGVPLTDAESGAVMEFVNAALKQARGQK